MRRRGEFVRPAAALNRRNEGLTFGARKGLTVVAYDDDDGAQSGLALLMRRNAFERNPQGIEPLLANARGGARAAGRALQGCRPGPQVRYGGSRSRRREC